MKFIFLHGVYSDYCDSGLIFGITIDHATQVTYLMKFGSWQLPTGVVLAIFTALSVFADKDKGITAGDFVMISGYVGMLTLQLRILAGALIDLEKQKVALADGIAYLKKPISENQAIKPLTLQNTDYVFELNDICIEKGGKQIIQNLSYRFINKKFTVIKGPSGRGKTSLINAMLGLEHPVSGQILFFGNPVFTNISTGIIEHVAVAPQSAQVISGSLRENLCYGIGQEAAPDMLLTDILELLNFTETSLARLINLDTQIDTKGDGLSGGERQRIAIGRAIARQKKIMILDEPTASLDLDNAKRIITYWRTHISTLIVISHDAWIQNMADEILELK